MHKLPHFVPALSHHLKPLMRDGTQVTRMFFHPRIDRGIPLDSAVESQQFRFHRSSPFCFWDLYLGGPVLFGFFKLTVIRTMTRVQPTEVLETFCSTHYVCAMTCKILRR